MGYVEKQVGVGVFIAHSITAFGHPTPTFAGRQAHKAPSATSYTGSWTSSCQSTSHIAILRLLESQEAPIY